MMIKNGLLASIGLVGIVKARLYATVEGGVIECPWDAHWTDFDMVAHLMRGGADWHDLHFDQAWGPMEALLLPEDFWANALSPTQTMEIILNPQLRPMLLKEENFWRAIERKQRSTKSKRRQKFLGLGRARKAIGRKLSHFRGHVKDVDPIVAGDQADEVMSAIPPETYKHSSPLLATLSRGFKATKKNVAKLFGFTVKGLRAIAPYLLPVVLAVLRLILGALITGALGMGGLGVMSGIFGLGDIFSFKSGAPNTQMGPFYIAHLLLDLLHKHPILDRFIGERVRLLVSELQRVMARLRQQVHKTDQKINQFNKRRQLKAKKSNRKALNDSRSLTIDNCFVKSSSFEGEESSDRDNISAGHRDRGPLSGAGKERWDQRRVPRQVEFK